MTFRRRSWPEARADGNLTEIVEKVEQNFAQLTIRWIRWSFQKTDRLELRLKKKEEKAQNIHARLQREVEDLHAQNSSLWAYVMRWKDYFTRGKDYLMTREHDLKTWENILKTREDDLTAWADEVRNHR